MESKQLFQPLDAGRKSPASAAASIVVHILVVAVLILAPVAMVTKVIKPKETITYLAPKPLEEYKPPVKVVLPKIKFKAMVLPPTVKPVVKLPEIKVIEPPKIIPPPIDPPKVVLNNPVVAPIPKVEPPPVKREVKTDVFATPNTVATNLSQKSPVKDVKTDTFGTQAAAGGAKSPTHSVQTGGFGDPNGVAPSKNSTNKGVVMAAFGSPDLPVGSGKGGGGGKAVVGSAGFGGGFTSAGPGGNGKSLGAVKSSGFGETVAAATGKKDTPVAPKETQVEILSKPKPAYTAQARELKIEGQVALEVTFTANGAVRVLRVLKGLGHGLDEAAEQAASSIRFKPATRDGAAVDSTNRVYIVFQLS